MLRPPIITMVSSILAKTSKTILRDFGEVTHLQNAVAGTRGFVKTLVNRTERSVYDAMDKAYPDHAFVFQSGAQNISAKPDAPRWAIHVLDGIDNFCRGIGHFAMVAALRERGRLTVAMVYDPLRNDLFWACKGGGCFLNQHRMRVSRRTTMGDVVLATDWKHGLTQHTSKALYTLSHEVADVRMLGCPALDLAYVAAGRLDGFFSHAASTASIDAGMLLIQEAGGSLMYSGDPSSVSAAPESSDPVPTASGPALSSATPALRKVIVAGNETVCRFLKGWVGAPLFSSGAPRTAHP